MGLWVWGLWVFGDCGFGVCGLGLRVWGLGFGFFGVYEVSGLVLGVLSVYGLGLCGFRVWCIWVFFGFVGLGFGLWVYGVYGLGLHTVNRQIP